MQPGTFGKKPKNLISARQVSKKKPGFGKKTSRSGFYLKTLFFSQNLIFTSPVPWRWNLQSWRASVKSANTRRTRLPVVLTHESADTISPTLLNTLMSYLVSHTLSPTLVCCLTGRKAARSINPKHAAFLHQDLKLIPCYAP